MNFYRNKGFWVVATAVSPLLLIYGYYEFKKITSVYKQDFGNGLIIYADDFVKSGRWVFDCRNSRLISHNPVAVPTAELKNMEKFTIGRAPMKQEDKPPAKEALNAIVAKNGWYKELSYIYSGLGELDELDSHTFNLIAEHNGRPWVVQVTQWIYGSKSRFTMTVKPYTPETYVDYARALKEALTSCPAPQQEHLPMPA